ncbi:MAG: Outer membrane protein assembly factor BamD [Verrucomicrobia subdivision 3 bacterium]|nr:Outer membrane protein assembly factor BamD [Limisphaerales bacterium]MCS1414427.1 Outer membrane protein assembly factor BamD [Limisphaerales bacterium]
MLVRNFIIALAFGAFSLKATTPGERIAFDAAVRAFEDRLYKRASEQFAEFAQLFPESNLTAKANAFSLRARAHHLARLRRYELAAAAFRELRLKFPNSPNYLEFVVGEAWNDYRQGNRDAVVKLLGDDGPFKLAATIRPNDPIALPLLVSGQLLLSQTYLDQGNYEASQQALNEVTDWDLQTEFDWRRRLIITRLQLANGELAEARKNANDLLVLASTAGVKEWIAESAATKGEVLIANNQPEAAIVAYQENLAPGIPANRRREAWFKIIELNLEQRDVRTVIELIEEFIAKAADDESLDIALLAIGKLHLQHFYEKAKPERPEEPRPPLTDLLNDALLALERLTREFPDSELFGQAQYHRGWCYWELGETAESVDAFQKAVKHLDESFEDAIARFKLADGYYVLKQYQDALDHYQKITATYGTALRVKETFLDQVLYQTVRAAVETNDVEVATAAVSSLVALYPDRLLTSTSRLIVGQHMIHINKVSEARGVFYETIEHFTEPSLKAEVEFAIAYTFELDGAWKSAATLYQAWLNDYPEHENRPRAAYALAWCTSQQGQQDEALKLFREFLRNHGQHELANMARLWMGNLHFTRQSFENAEQYYASVLNPTNRAPNHLVYRAGLMAGRATFRQNKFEETIQYLKNLNNSIREDESVAISFKQEVEINLGDAYFENSKRNTEDPTSQIPMALFHYSNVSVLEDSNRLHAIARGRFGDALYFRSAFEDAIAPYTDVIKHSEADITTRSQAEVALGMVLDRQAEQVTGAASASLRNKALQHYLNIVYLRNLRDGEVPDPYWLKEAGLKASALVEAEQDFETGIELYERLAELLPPLRPEWDRLRLALEAKRSG